VHTSPQGKQPLHRRTRHLHRTAVGSALVPLALVAALADGAASSATATTVPTNRLANPSFERGLAPWGGTDLHRVRVSAAPHGDFVVRVSTVRGRLAIDDWPGELGSAAGATYRGHMYLRAASRSAIGRSVTLVVREHTPGGDWVASAQTTSRLTRAFHLLQTQLRGVRAGDTIDIYAYEHNARAGDRMFADGASLSVRRPTRPAPKPTTPAPAPVTTPSPSSSLSPGAPSSTAAASVPAGSTIGELSIDTGQADHLGDTSRYGYVILQDYMYAHVAAIKQANPNTKVLAYLEAPVTQTRTCSDSTPPAYSAHDSFGVNYCYADVHHPAWFLTDGSGNRLTYTDYPRSAVMDVGNTSYRNACAANAIAAAKADGFDGIYLDDANTYPGHGIDGRIHEYTDQAYGQAMTGFIASAADQLRANGLLAVANVAANPWVSWQRADALTLAAHLTALAREHYVRYGDICGPFSARFNTTATNGTPPIADMLAYDQAVQAAGAHLLGTDYGYTPATAADVATMSYGRALFLLAWDGKAGSAYVFRPCGTVDPYAPAWQVDLGTPAGPVTLVGGVYERQYSLGLVLLNPAPSAAVTVSVPAGYVTTGGAAVTTAVLPAQGALLLRKA
jgi:hypothetical protein